MVRNKGNSEPHAPEHTYEPHSHSHSDDEAETSSGHLLQSRYNLSRDENTFFVCNVEDHGQLVVKEAEKPRVRFEEIYGKSFQPAKRFFESVMRSNLLGGLYSITSPSKQVSRSNMLLIGPPGCGKTLFLKAIASDPEFITIYASGSDFLTCWQGEAEKNPKRLFQQAMELYDHLRRHIFLAIDEIDSLFATDSRPERSYDFLASEFRSLLDGMLEYEPITLCGTTNMPNRMPVSVLRRFSFVDSVGELDLEDRASLLEHYLTLGIPLSSKIKDSDYLEFAQRLEGATGDIIRKVADGVWREVVDSFALNYPQEALNLADYLNKGGPFKIQNVSQKQRNYVKRHIGARYRADWTLINKHIDEVVNNASIQRELEEIKKFYHNAREIIKNIQTPG